MRNKLLIAMILFLAMPAFAKFTYEGYLTKTDGITPEDSSNVRFRVKVRNPMASCLLYEELAATVDMTNSNGYFSINIGDGTGTPTDYTGRGLEGVFSNATAMTGQTTCPYTPAAGDSRKIGVEVSVNMSAWEDFGTINFHPAQNAVNAEKIGKYSPTHLLRVEDGGVPMPATALTSSNMTELMELINGNSSLYATPGATGITALTNDVTTPGAGSGVATIANGAVTSAKIADGAITTAKLALSGVTANTYGSPTQIPQITVDLTGRITVANSVAVSVPGSAVGGLGVNGLVTTNGAGYLSTASCSVGQVMQYSGSAWTCAMMPSPSDFLLRDGSAPMLGQVRATTSGGATTPGYGFDSAQGNGMYYTGTNTIGFATAMNERMLIDGSGNVGIGTNPPTERLDVSGNVKAMRFIPTGTATVETSCSSFATGTITMSTSGPVYCNSGSTWKMIGPWDISAGVYYTPTGNKISLGSGTSSSAAVTVKNSVAPSYPAFHVKGMSGQTGPLFEVIDGSAMTQISVNSSGNMGIGTTTPPEKLSVVGNLNVAGQHFSEVGIIPTGATVDFNTGNTQVLQSAGGSAITLNNLKSGARYTVIVTDTNSRTYTFNNCMSAYFSPANAATTASTATVYDIRTASITGNMTCFISWSTYQ